MSEESHNQTSQFDEGDLAWVLFILFVSILMAPFHLAAKRIKRLVNRD